MGKHDFHLYGFHTYCCTRCPKTVDLATVSDEEIEKLHDEECNGSEDRVAQFVHDWEM